MAIGLATAIGMGISAAAGVGNAVANMSAADRAAAIQDKNLQEWIKIHIPDLEEQKIALQRFVDVGDLDPKLEKAINQNPTEFQKIATPVAEKQAQMRSLGELQKIGDEGGLRLQDKAALQDSMLEGQAQDRGNRDALTAEYARRGLGGSGFEFASKLASQQSGADRDAKNSLNIAAGAQARGLEALMNAGNLATQYRTQDFGEQAQKATAQDTINKFNTANMQDVQQRNVTSQNAASAQNLADKQKIADQNVNLTNQEEQYNKSLIQQQFENQAKVQAGKTGQYDKLAGTATQAGQNLGNTFTNVGQGVSGGLASASSAQMLDDYLKDKKKKEALYGTV